MVTGIDKFQKYFAGHEDHYAIIGGAACDLLFDEAGLDFRATKDIDMVLCVEVVDVVFGTAFKEFLDAGGYQARERSTGDKEFYRFHKPLDASFPFMIELFSRKPGTLDLPENAELTPIPVEEDIVSLSAILLDDGYYEALQSAKRKIEDAGILEVLQTPGAAYGAWSILDALLSPTGIGTPFIFKQPGFCPSYVPWRSFGYAWIGKNHSHSIVPGGFDVMS